MQEKIKAYYQLTKPGVLYGNVLTALAGFFLASQAQVNIWLFWAMLIGISCLVASACVLNNYLDQDIDAIMQRTQKRPLVRGVVSGQGAVIFSTSLGLIGVGFLYAYTTLLATIVGILGFVIYVVLYGMLSKRLSIHGTLVGSISGAAPILVGYTAVSGTLDTGAILVFLILFFWQMPEFYSISIYRLKEYKAARIPVMSVIKGVPSTKLQILLYTIAFVMSTLLLTTFGYTGLIYFIVMLMLGLYWIKLGIHGLSATNNNVWARQMFRFSLIILLVFCLMISIDAILPRPII